MARFGTVLTAMVTPFDADGALDLPAAQNLAKYLVEHGNDGVIVAGTTGESPTISFEEQRELFVAVREAIPNHQVVAGGGSNDTATAIKNTAMAAETGADAILAVSPYYNRPSQAGLVDHFTQQAAATDRPIMIYDVPTRTGRRMEPETIVKLAELDNVVAMKDAGGRPAVSAEVIAEVDGALDWYSGDDSLTLPLLSVGACGVVGVATHWVGTEMSQMIAAFSDGKVDEARRLNAAMLESFSYANRDEAPSPLPTKVIMNLLGVPVGMPRPPMAIAPADAADRAHAVLAGLGRAAV